MRNDDVALVRYTLAGDEAAFATLVEKYRKQVHTLAWRTIGDFHIAQDITQETFLNAYQKLDALKDPQRFSGWLNSIARRLCLAWFREKRLSVQLSENISSATIRNDPYSGYLVGEQADEASRELREIVKKWLAKLSENERTVITLHYFDGMLCEDIATFLGVTPNTVKSRLNRARNRLKKNESLGQSALDDFQSFATLSERVKTERKIRICIEAATENGEQFKEGGVSLIKTDVSLRLSSCGWEEHDKSEPVTMPLLGITVTPFLLKFPLVMGDTCTQEGFWHSHAETTLEGYEQVEVSAGIFPTCLKHKSVIINTPPHLQNNLLTTTNGKPYGQDSKKREPICQRYALFVVRRGSRTRENAL